MLKSIVEIVMGSDSDIFIMEEAEEVLKEFKIPYSVRIISAHRTPDIAGEYGRNLLKRGVRVIIAGAGAAAHLAGAIASHTTIPVIGVPLSTSPLSGIDSLLSTVQMPGGIPVATMAIGKAGAKNAAIFAVQILSLEDKKLAEALKNYKKKMADEVVEKDRKLRKAKSTK
ncbi:MAG: 5-(carboxyamino)imidazole ribonucleotide mutase [Candidatus Schekmanbacteria bacterium RIFCSPHIGHO2_02_FULL_38_11]|uniref:N5-carboxyaminoimidazole ribonucleotide mutase n=1 Tax=Candidatus Schekmanbacteria bacterium RIFCSPLOWO2_12_FULL_38_15 TaxID=1817883 RepID=A0A1F7SE60_9BACT|nr:MAG: 5-(carboxyamino)imidazole ribonucleotide mutase [Candidatus Schekmanbacteria bacterium GWA2_38_9]OGL49075.1 MAG: 5-(carboxyamino)imidazole ribonucleotide mutase [Candidatus Schekmanbacteria bacterium RIFCSPLOWO2_02_FULL_38_14]OGL49200.1 MAG: 5-(carboxyamino)imidazole ribonucleotide mutase [Candidatus Schekmanbacteria bacterium RIFCSPHIGHO2_02_FULL_38_11]OGL52050.1 MAG: 5-(carboxyamino)imidazole ribonucleotide mutase [Candidatus Schekmanbacteria bacterium RIFCSPLOWO2_12_FULL_38_15]